MKILAPVKQVARLTEDFQLDDAGVLVPGSLEWQLNEWDAFAVEAALRLVEADGEGEVLVATVGDEQAEPGLRACLAMGAERAIRIWSEDLAGADSLAVAAVLAALARREAPELILCGAQSSDAANAATGVALAGLLDLPRAVVVNAIERDGSKLRVQRELDGGAIEALDLPMPALLTVQTGIHAPRRANLRAIKQARSTAVELLDPGELGLDREQLRVVGGSRIVRLLEPERTVTASMIEGSPGEIAQRIAALVKEAVER